MPMTRREKSAKSLERFSPRDQKKAPAFRRFSQNQRRDFYVWLFSHSLLALNPARPLAQYRIAMWNQENGLLQDSILALAQTPDGFLWAQP
jgi:hypothetical protein